MSFERTFKEDGCQSLVLNNNGAFITYRGESATIQISKKIDGQDIILESIVIDSCQSGTVSVAAKTGDVITVCVYIEEGCVVIGAYSADVTSLCPFDDKEECVSIYIYDMTVTLNVQDGPFSIPAYDWVKFTYKVDSGKAAVSYDNGLTFDSIVTPETGAKSFGSGIINCTEYTIIDGLEDFAITAQVDGTVVQLSGEYVDG